MIGESNAGTGIGGRTLRLPVMVRQILCDSFVVVVRSGVQAALQVVAGFGGCRDAGEVRPA
jgi:hypothetical protein